MSIASIIFLSGVGAAAFATLTAGVITCRKISKGGDTKTIITPHIKTPQVETKEETPPQVTLSALPPSVAPSPPIGPYYPQYNSALPYPLYNLSP